jgi:cysteine-rich repeat protein
MRWTRWAVWVLAASLAVTGARVTRAQIHSDRAAAVVSYPFISVDTARGIDTAVQLSNTSDTEVVDVRCFYTDATGHCSNAPALACSSGLDCPPGGTCVPAWNHTDFVIHLTRGQPIGWRASTGLGSLPLPDNQGVIPPVPADPFVGSLLCIAVNAAGAPADRNVLTGEATLENYRTLPGKFLDSAKYNAIGIEAIPGAVNGDGVLVLGGPSPEYRACPLETVVNHFFDGAIEPASGASTVSTELVLVPCTQNLFDPVSPAPVVVVYNIRNEFEQLLSASRVFQCQQAVHLADINSLFSVGVAGTLTGQTRLSTVMGGGLLAVAVEQHRSTADATRVMTAAFNVHAQGERVEADTIKIDEVDCGNGVLDAGEQCDDGNRVSGDCCSATCHLEANGSPCNDANACTRTDICQAGACVGVNPVRCSTADQCHLRGVCNPATGTCSAPPAPNGVRCDDRNACTRTDRCVAGVCTGTNPVRCTAADRCHVGNCDPRTGMCVVASAPDGTLCDDFDECTQVDVCEDGECVGTDRVACVPRDECHVAGTCDCGVCSNPPAPNGTPCGNGGRCQGGACNHAPSCSAAVARPGKIAPDNKFVKVKVDGVTDPDGDRVSITIRGITQDEAVRGVADGDACPDGAAIGDATVRLRAERDGSGNGRVYHVHFGASDGRGGRCRGEVTVCVPLGPGTAGSCVDERRRILSTSPCS